MQAAFQTQPFPNQTIAKSLFQTKQFPNQAIAKPLSKPINFHVTFLTKPQTPSQLQRKPYPIPFKTITKTIGKPYIYSTVCYPNRQNTYTNSRLLVLHSHILAKLSKTAPKSKLTPSQSLRQVKACAKSKLTPSQSLRQVKAYAKSKPTPSQSLRQIKAYAKSKPKPSQGQM